MKYFCMRAEKLPHPMPNMLSNVAYEVDAEKAFDMYALVVKDQHMAMIELLNGTCRKSKYWSIWGEHISDAECFQRRLSGKLAIDILE